MYQPVPVDEDRVCFLNESNLPRSKRRFQRRHVLAAIAFFGFANIYAMRANLSVSIVQMTTDEVKYVDGVLKVQKAEFANWDSLTQGAILSAFFYGYILTQLPGGYFAHNYGGKIVFLIGVFGTAAFTLITPPVAHMGKYMLIGLRFLEGLLEGVTYPAMHVVWGRWAPRLERTRLASLAYSGSYFGTVFAMPMSAFIGYKLGWPFVFYFFGCLAFLWCFIWLRCVSELPEKDLHITTDELALLQKDATNVNLYTVPWKDILKSKAVWAIVIAHFCENWGFYTMLTSLPRFFSDVMEAETAGYVSALPYLVMGTVLLFSGNLADILRERHLWSTERTRKYFCCIGFISQAVFLLLATIYISNASVVFTIIVSVGLGGLPWSAFSVNHLDLAPQYAGHLMGLSNTIATLPGMLSPLVVGYLVTEHSAIGQWRLVFILTTSIYVLGALVYWRWAKGETEDWASSHNPFYATAE